MKQNTLLGLLACSLIFNAFLAGYIVSSHANRPPMPPSPLHRMEMAARHLGPEYEDEITTLIKDNQKQLDEDMDQLGSAFNDIHPILTAPQFDEKKLKSLHARLYKYDDRVKEGMLQLLTRIAKKLPDAERIRFFNEINPGDHGFPGPPPPDEFDR